MAMPSSDDNAVVVSGQDALESLTGDRVSILRGAPVSGATTISTSDVSGLYRMLQGLRRGPETGDGMGNTQGLIGARSALLFWMGIILGIANRRCKHRSLRFLVFALASDVIVHLSSFNLPNLYTYLPH